jgi:DNA-binding CsgD family transcriptional regulator
VNRLRAQTSATPRRRVKLTANQRAILVRLFAGERETEIALSTNRSPSTIFNTIRLVRERFGARTEYDLMRECLCRRIMTLAEICNAAETRTASAHR